MLRTRMRVMEMMYEGWEVEEQVGRIKQVMVEHEKVCKEGQEVKC